MWMQAQAMSTEEVLEASARCDEEPIQWVGSIQGHGALLVVEVESRCITHASTNLDAWLDRSAESVIG